MLIYLSTESLDLTHYSSLLIEWIQKCSFGELSDVLHLGMAEELDEGHARTNIGIVQRALKLILEPIL
jgi:hypothetical protein